MYAIFYRKHHDINWVQMDGVHPATTVMETMRVHRGNHPLLVFAFRRV